MSFFHELLTIWLVPIDYETGDIFALGSPTASASTHSWLFRSPLPFDTSRISMLVVQSS